MTFATPCIPTTGRMPPPDDLVEDQDDRPDDEGDVATIVEPLRAELEGLVRMAARRPNLVVRLGDPGSPWAFSWDTDSVRVDPEHLRSLAPDLCRGLALHEAAHAAVTVLHRILSDVRLARLLPLLNTLEDIRIEVWMRSRFPGAGAWIRAYNDVFYGFNRGRSQPRSRQVQFLLGILERWWFGTASPAILPEVTTALEECHEAIAATTACQPPLDEDPAGILSSQQAMWEIVRRRILSTWERLVALDRREGIRRLATDETARFVESTGQSRHRARRGSSRLRPARGRCRTPAGHRTMPKTARRRPPRHSPAGADQSSHDGAGGAIPPAPAPPPTDGTDTYLRAWKRIAPLADRLGDELLRVLVPRQRLRWSTGHAWGPRLDLRRAMQFEADPQLHDSLWCRPILPQRRDPAVLLLVDRSSSMATDERMDHAFEGTVLLTEVCRRIGVPAAVWSFASGVREELHWDAPADAAARRRLGLLPERCNGNTDMAAALAVVGRELAARRGDPRLLFVIGDGEPDKPDASLAAVRQIEAAGIATVGLGLGAGTAKLARFFHTAVTDIPSERLVDHVADLLGRALLAMA